MSLKAGYDRNWKASHGITLTAEEFAAEAGKQYSETAAEVYDILSRFVQEKKLSAADLFRYARFKWCLRDPAAIIAYQGHGFVMVADIFRKPPHFFQPHFATPAVYVLI